ncbi:type I methionyl aminopeptidase [Terriglobus saanensis]|uniref:Methionine aminopeptidase n=1 Tax=Terriglobus saanensis (strain ATCC BAA-1853 / DSM 23119 / SP1PR4) TaxID=401053 RepID=E8V7J6_TERSS|nr:type I methionyl aminopeptidase [Terriglobus saanensis]ADV83970.1 methionine aminopeptidase, type I [Terriglobus saanensis SP1PR4]
MAIAIKTPQEIQKMRRSGEVLSQVHEAVRQAVKPGVSTMDLEKIAERKIAELGGKPAFKGYMDYPACLCTSVNNEVIHGIPSASKQLKDGDIVSVDCGVILDGYYSDAAVTHAVGKTSAATRKLLEVTKQSLEQAIQEVKVGQTLGDIGAAVQEFCEAEGFGVVREFVGHGIGKKMHEDPQVPNYGKRGKGTKLRAGMVLAIEPMINAGRPEVKVLGDGWTAVTVDGSWSAHFEHTVAVTEDGPLVLTR